MPCRAGAWLALLGVCAIAPARADSNVTYNFNSDNGIQNGWSALDVDGAAPAWSWIQGSSSVFGGWHAMTGSNAANSAAYLTSPCFVLNANNQNELLFRVNHRFDFPLTGTTANQVGQIQYRADTTGSGWGPWSGIPTTFFTTGTYAPDYGPPLFPPLIVSATITTGTMPVQAWAGTTDRFSEGIHHRTDFTLPLNVFGLANGNEIQFRFAMATDTAVSGSALTIVWELNKVEVFGVYECPEPETLALAAVGGLGCLVFVGRRQRRSRSARKLSRSAAATILLAAAVVGLFAAAPAEAATSWNFQTNDGGWTRTSASPFVFPPDFRWTWTGTYSGTLPITGGTSPHWRVVAMGIQPPFSAGHFLTSPVFSGLSGTIPAQNARISIAHEFNYATGTSGLPINTGQLQYSVDGGPWLGLPLEAYTSGSSVLGIDPVFGPSPFASGTVPVFVDQTEFLAPTYLTPVGTGSLAYVSPGAAAFLGTSPGWPGDFYVPSQTFLNANFGLPSTGISSLQLRFTNLNRAGNCTDEGWNVRFVQVDFDTGIPPVPEPATIALGATALATVVAAGAIRRRGHQRASRPSERPWTTTLPAVSVAPRMGSSWHSWLTPYCSGARASPPSQKIA